MKIFIQHARTKEFYAGEGQWVATRSQAADYPTALKAQEIAKRDHLDGVSMVFTFTTGRQSIIIPLTIRERPATGVL